MGVWIETANVESFKTRGTVTPHVGVWIETEASCISDGAPVSLPTWECGLKQILSFCLFVKSAVTPHVGVWIETAMSGMQSNGIFVTPHVGVWIETPDRISEG